MFLQAFDVEDDRADGDRVEPRRGPRGSGPVDRLDPETAALMAARAHDLAHRHVGLIAQAFEKVTAAGAEIAAPRPLVRQRQLAGNGDERIVVLVRSRHRHRAEQTLRVRVAHGAEHIPDRARLDRLARIHHRHFVAGLEYEPEIVGDEQRRGAGASGEVLDERDDARFHGDVERGRGLVEDEQLRIGKQRHGDDHALLLAAAELVGIGAHDPLRVRQAHGLDHVDGAGAGLVPRDLVMDQRHFHQLAPDQHGRIERGHRLLIDHRDLRAADGAQLPLGEARHVAALEPDRAIGDPPDPGEVAHDGERDRRLAAAQFADQSHRLPGHDLAREVHDRRNFAAAGEERNAQSVDLENGIGHALLHQSRSDCSRIASASRLRPSTNDIIASAGGRAGWT